VDRGISPSASHDVAANRCCEATGDNEKMAFTIRTKECDAVLSMAPGDFQALVVCLSEKRGFIAAEAQQAANNI
jgi:hypothetical protein